MVRKKLIFSIIIPTCNRLELLKKSIDSIIEFSNLDEIEIIVIDDCGGSQDIINSYNFNNLIYFVNNGIKGANACRLLGIKKSTGDFIIFLDDDDYWLKNRYHQLKYYHLEKNYDFLFVGYKIVSSNYIKLFYLYLLNKILSTNTSDLFKGNYLGGFSIFSINRKYFDNNKIKLDLKLDSCQDWDLFIQLFLITNNKIDLKKKSIAYNVHNFGNITKTIEKVYRGRLNIFFKYYKYFNKNIKKFHIVELLILRSEIYSNYDFSRFKLIFSKGTLFQIIRYLHKIIKNNKWIK